MPDSYPLTLNTALLGCNQKTSREPLMELSESEVSSAVDSLREAGLVHETSGGRAVTFTHNAQRGIGVPEQSAVLLGLLMLRGPQTAAELRLNAERGIVLPTPHQSKRFWTSCRNAAKRKAALWSSSWTAHPARRTALGPPAVRPGRGQRGGHQPVWRCSGPRQRGAPGRVTQLEAEVSNCAHGAKLCAELGMSQPGQE